MTSLETFNNMSRPELVSVISSYIRYIEVLSSQNNIYELSDYIAFYRTDNPFHKGNIATMDRSSILEYAKELERNLSNYLLSIAPLLPQKPLSLDKYYLSSEYKSSPYISPSQAETLIRHQNFFIDIFKLQEQELTDSLSPSVFVFVAYKSGGNLFTHDLQINRNNPHIVSTIDGEISVLDLNERVEFAYVAKQGYCGVLELRTGDYNDLIFDEQADVLHTCLSPQTSDAPYSSEHIPYFSRTLLPESELDNFRCTRSLCPEFLCRHTLQSSELELAEINISGALKRLSKSMMSEDIEKTRLFCDIKSPNTFYTLDEHNGKEDVLHRIVQCGDPQVSVWSQSDELALLSHSPRTYLIPSSGREFSVNKRIGIETLIERVREKSHHSGSSLLQNRDKNIEKSSSNSLRRKKSPAF